MTKRPIRRDMQIQELITAGASPREAIQAVHHPDDRLETLFALGLQALLAFRGGWEATRELAEAMDLHPLAFSAAYASGLSDAEAMEALGTWERYIVRPKGGDPGLQRQERYAGILVSGVRLVLPGPLGSSEAVALELADIAFLLEGSARVPSTAESGRGGPGLDAAGPKRPRGVVLVSDPAGLRLNGDGSRMELHTLRGAVFEAGGL